jgi:hypothetical protein
LKQLSEETDLVQLNLVKKIDKGNLKRGATPAGSSFQDKPALQMDRQQCEPSDRFF